MDFHENFFFDLGPGLSEEVGEYHLGTLEVFLILALAFSVTLAPLADQLLAANLLDLSWFLTWDLAF